jgi:hypothetical protein
MPRKLDGVEHGLEQMLVVYPSLVVNHAHAYHAHGQATGGFAAATATGVCLQPDAGL